MNPALPKSTEALLASTWTTYQPVYEELAARGITAANVDAWLMDWSDVASCVYELKERLYVAKTRFTADEKIDKQFNDFMDNIYPAYLAAEQKLKEKLLASGLEPKGYAVQMRNMRAEADLYRDENLPLLAEEQKMISEYDAIIGAQTVPWEGREVTITQLKPVYLETDRALREKAWRLSTSRQLADRDAYNALWQRFLDLRFSLARNSGKPDFRAYMWQKLFRFDYTPADAKKFGDAIEQAVVPAARRIYARRQKLMGLSSLRPWDLDVDPLGRPPLHPFQDEKTLISKTSSIFHQVDPELGEYFDIMVREDLLDLMNRKNKGPGAYCDTFPLVRKPFIFHNAVGMHDDVQTMLHESGHAFHVFEAGQAALHRAVELPDGDRRGGFDEHGAAGSALPESGEGRVLQRPGLCPRAHRAPGGQHPLLALYGRGGWLPALGLRASRPGERPPQLRCRLERPVGALHAGRGLVRAGGDQSHRLAPKDAHLRGALLLHRIRPGADGRRHGLAQRPAGSGRRGESLPPRAQLWATASPCRSFTRLPARAWPSMPAPSGS